MTLLHNLRFHQVGCECYFLSRKRRVARELRLWGKTQTMRILTMSTHPKHKSRYVAKCSTGWWIWHNEVDYTGPYSDGSWRCAVDGTVAPLRHQQILNAHTADTRFPVGEIHAENTKPR